MRYIANILTEEPYPNSTEFLNVTSDKNKLLPDIPTLVIGWDMTKREYPEASIIEWVIDENIYWTFGKYERRDRFEQNIKKFNEIVFKNIIKSITYKFYDVLFYGEEKFMSFISSISNNTNISTKSETHKTIYVLKDMMYIYFDGDDKIIGVSLSDCDFIDKTYRKMIFSEIYKSNSVKLLKNNEDISSNARFITRNTPYILPYLYS